MSEAFDRSPTRFSTVVAIGAAFVATASSAIVSMAALATGLPGVVGVFAGLYRGSRRLLAFGVLGILLGSMIAGAAGAPALTLLVSVTAGILTWDYATTAISLGRQLGRAAETERLERVHALASVGVGTVVVTISYGIYRSITGTHPVAAVFFLLLAAILLIGALR